MDAKEALLEYFDKIALGVAVLAFVGFVGLPLLGESPAEKRQAEIESYNRKISALRAVVQEKAPKPEPLEAARAVRRALAGGPAPETWPSWLMHKRVLITCRRIGIAMPDPPAHFPPVDLSGAGGLGAITLQWADNPRDRLVKIVRYRVERNDVDPQRDDAWKTIATVGGKVHRYRDTEGLEAGKAYWYRVVSVAQEDQGLSVVRKYDLELPEPQRERVSSVVGPFRTQPEQYLELQSVRTKSIEHGQIVEPLAYVKVYKFFPDDGEWKPSPLLTVKPGERIGTTVRRGGKSYDWSSPWELVTTRRRTRKRKLGGGVEITEQVDVAVLRNVETGEEIEINNKDRDPVLEKIKADPRYGTDAAAGGEEREEG
ncbi:MAG: fibronectin type III domain-containing protein [Planctomycetota bacterium]|nr:MAG: fibronectin type III domain-containing protein [Planctomycetota bacterium]